MKNIKLLVVFLSLVTVIAGLVLLYRRTNILLSHYENMTRDLDSIKSFLTKNVKPPSTQAPATESSPTQKLARPTQAPTTFNRDVLEKRVNNEPPYNKIKVTQNNIEELRASIAGLEDMISSSSESSSEEADDESSLDRDITNESPQLQNVQLGNNLESYDLADVENENSELEDLLNSNTTPVESNVLDTVSTVSNPQESGELSNKSISEEVTSDIILNTYSKRDLENLCANNYLSKSGNKTVLIERLLDSGYKFNKKSNTQTNAVSIST